MRKSYILCLIPLIIICLLTEPAGGQEKSQTKKKEQENVILPKSEEHEVDVRLVLVDVIAVDRQDNVVTDLNKDDFELFEDGQPMPLNSLDFIKLQTPVTGEVREKEIRRQKTFFVIFDSINSTKRILDKNRDKILEKLISLSRMGHEVMVLELKEDKNMEILQPLTPDESLITAAVKKASGSIWVESASDALSVPHILAGEPISRLEEMEGHHSVEMQFKEANRQMYEIQTRKRFEKTISGLLSAMNVIKDIPGRKPVLYISSGFPNISFESMYNQSGGIDQGFVKSQVSLAKVNDPFKVLGETKKRQGSDIFKDLIQFANSHNISFYTIDPDNYLRFVLPDIAYDNFPRKISSPYDFNVFQDEISEIKRIELNNLSNLAKDTGGKTLQGGDRFDNFEKYITRDLKSHYELSYYPTRPQADGRYHDIKVNVKRDGIKLRAREGYFDYLTEQKEQLMFASASANPDMFKDVDFQFSGVPFKTEGDKLRLWVNLGLPVKELILGGDQYKEYTVIKTNLWMDDTEGTRAFSAQMDIPIILSSSFRERLARAEFFGYNICSDEMKLKPGSYTLVFAVYDQESGMVGTKERSLDIPDYKKDDSSIYTAQIGQFSESPRSGKAFTLSSEDATLITRTGKFYPLAGSEFSRGDPLVLYIQIYRPEQTPEPAPKFDLVQEGYIVGAIPSAPLEKAWDSKARVWHLLYRLQINRFTAGEYSLRILSEAHGSGDDSVRYIPFQLR